MSCSAGRMHRKHQRRQKIKQEEPTFYVCTACGNELFEEDKKFDSGTGFPSFWSHFGENVEQKFLDTYGRERIQLLCKRCGLHLGHLFPNKKTPTKLRYCINAASIALEEADVD